MYQNAMKYTILPIALQLADGSYLTSSNLAIGLWDQITVIPCGAINDPHHAAWALFQMGADGQLEKYMLICDDRKIVEAALGALQSN